MNDHFEQQMSSSMFLSSHVGGGGGGAGEGFEEERDLHGLKRQVRELRDENAQLTAENEAVRAAAGIGAVGEVSSCLCVLIFCC